MIEAQVAKQIAIKAPGWKEHDGLILWEERIYVPKIETLREKIIRENHDSTLVGHPGIYKTMELITHDYWWPRIKSDIERYVKGCQIC